MSNIIAVSLGAIFGATFRYLLQTMGNKITTFWPMGTFFANILGCFFVGIAYKYLHNFPIHYKLLVLTGFFGSLTTFSNFSLDLILMMEEQKYLKAAVFWGASNIVCIFSCALGAWIYSLLTD